MSFTKGLQNRLIEWDTEPPLVAGKDLKAGGTWMGLTENGRFAALTNYRNLKEIKEDAPSRGELVTRFLMSNGDFHESLKNINRTSDVYNGFNLLAGSPENLFYMTNKKEKLESVKPGFHAISNAFLNTPWPKTEWALEKLKNSMQTSHPNEEQIFGFLTDTRRYPSDQLPKTGLPDDIEKAVSSVFIQTDNYGTRCSSLVYMNRNREITFVERTFRPGTSEIETEQRFEWMLE
jgi:uncharacterized protein with NRDE domain